MKYTKKKSDFNDYFRATGLVMAGAASLSLGSCREVDKNSSAVENPPNIILILADDLGFSDIGCFGSEIQTPNLDRLAYNGIRFTNIHNTSKCFPSRASLLTGLYAQQCGYGKSHRNPISNAVTLGELLKTAGYRTLWSGKHHGLENPVTRGFDRYYGLKDGATNYFNPGKQRPGESKPAQKRGDREWCIDSTLYKPYTPSESDFYTTDYFTNYALQWLEEYKEEEKPYFLYMAYTAPHDPLQAWPEDIEKYRGKYMEGYEEIRKARYAKQKKEDLLDERYRLSEPDYTPWEELDDSVKIKQDLKMAVYAAMIDRMDQNIGRILNKVKEMGEEENTLVLFFSDNGASAEVVRIPGSGPIGSMTRWTSLGPDWANVGNTPFRYFKNYSFEGGIRSPGIAYWPDGIENPGRISEFPGHFIDIMPTLAEITGAVYPETFNSDTIFSMEGISLLPVLRDKQMNRMKTIYWKWAKGKALLDHQWKLVKHGINSNWELYNMKIDPVETNNMAKEYPDTVKILSERHAEWEAKMEKTEP